MIYKIVRYKVQSDKVEMVKQAIAEFVDAIAQAEPQTRYDAYQTAEATVFTHFMAFPDAEAEKYHQTAPHTTKFVQILYPNCEEQPVFTDLQPVRSTLENV